MMAVVGTRNPVSVAFEVVSDLRHYSTGVYQSNVCNKTSDSVNHAVLAVGYGARRLSASPPPNIRSRFPGHARHFWPGGWEFGACVLSTFYPLRAMCLSSDFFSATTGNETGVPFWTIKNSWSEAWGNRGYFNILRNVNMCGIATCASFPVLDVPTKP